VLGQCADLCQSSPHVRLHPARSVSVQSVRELGTTGCRLLLLHYAVHNRVRRLRTGHQPRLVALSEERRVWSVPDLRPRAHCYVLQLDAGRGEEQISKAWASSWSHQVDLHSIAPSVMTDISAVVSLRKVRNLTSDNDTENSRRIYEGMDRARSSMMYHVRSTCMEQIINFY